MNSYDSVKCKKINAIVPSIGVCDEYLPYKSKRRNLNYYVIFRSIGEGKTSKLKHDNFLKFEETI
jgi:hypothetical protein